jgi:hypothetical protein
MMNWLSDLTNQHKELESPESFWYWSAIAAISAVIKDQVWLDRQIYNLYPNIYVMLHAESGLKKGPPISMAKQLVKPVNNTRIISGRSSIQGILKDLGTGYTIPGGKVVSKSVAFICSSELSSSIVEDKVATKILTDLYDRQYNIGEWRSLLKMETFELKDPTITMLTATNEAMSEDFFSKSAIQGGYFARTFIVYEKESQNSNSLIYPLSNPPNYNTSAEYLRQIAKLNGPFKPLALLEKNDEYKYKKIRHGREIWFNAAGSLYEDWYESFTAQNKELETRDETGTLNRFGDSVLKVAMLLSLARQPVLELSEEAMSEAITKCEKLLGNVRKTTLGKHGTSTSAQLKTMIILELLNRPNHQVTRTVLMKKMWMHYSTVAEFDDLMLSFHHNGIVQTYNIGNQVMYEMPPLEAEKLRRLMEGKSK